MQVNDCATSWIRLLKKNNSKAMLKLSQWELKNLRTRNDLYFLELIENNGDFIRLVVDEVDIESNVTSYSYEGVMSPIAEQFILENWKKITKYIKDNG